MGCGPGEQWGCRPDSRPTPFWALGTSCRPRSAQYSLRPRSGTRSRGLCARAWGAQLPLGVARGFLVISPVPVENRRGAETGSGRPRTGRPRDRHTQGKGDTATGHAHTRRHTQRDNAPPVRTHACAHGPGKWRQSPGPGHWGGWGREMRGGRGEASRSPARREGKRRAGTRIPRPLTSRCPQPPFSTPSPGDPRGTASAAQGSVRPGGDTLGVESG